MKKKMVIGLIVVMLATMLSGCKGGSSDTSKQGEDGVVTLTFMGWEASPLETEAVKNGIKEFEAQHKNIKVEYTPVGSGGTDYDAKLLAAAASKTLPDVYFMQSASYRSFVSKDSVADITERFDDSFPIDDFIGSSRKIMEVDGRIYGISSCTVSPIVYYNKDVFDSASVDYPNSDPNNAWTIEEFREKAKQLTTDDIYGFYGVETTILPPLILSNGGTMYNDDYTKSTINTSEAKEVFDIFKEMREIDKTTPYASTLENVGMTAAQMLQTGKVAMLLDGSWALQELAGSNMNIGMAPLPSFGEANTVGQAHLHCISPYTEHEEEAWEFLKFLSGMEYQGALVNSGLWMPNRLSMYEKDKVDEWYDDNVHGDSYKNMLDYFKDAKVDPAALQPVTKCTDILTEEMTLCFQDGQDVQMTLDNIEQKIDAAISEANK